MSLSQQERTLRTPPTAIRQSGWERWVFTHADGTKSFVKGASAVGAVCRKDASPRHERAAYLVARALGFRTLVPTTVLSKVGGRVVSVQAWVDGDVASRRRGGGWLTIHPKIQTFDYIINNQDRHSGNLMVQGKRAYRAIDNAFSFGTTEQSLPSSFIFKPAWYALLNNPQRLKAQLVPLVGVTATRAVLGRLRRLADAHERRGRH